VHQVQGRATERIGKACEPMSTRRIAQVVGERRGDDWSASDTQTSIHDVSPRGLEDARRLLTQAPDPTRRGFARERDGDLLRRLGLVSPGGTLTVAGELLFVGREDRGHDIAYVFRRTASGELVVNERVRVPMLTAVVRVLELIEARVDRTPVNFSGGQQQQGPG
jgi:ATP-dependent DNA helicase RecG